METLTCSEYMSIQRNKSQNMKWWSSVIDPLIFEGRDIRCFELIDKIGAGSYGQVFKARDKFTGEIVAIKKLKLQDDDDNYASDRFLQTSMREISLLSQLRHHDNIINVREVLPSIAGKDFFSCSHVYVVLDYMQYDLGRFHEMYISNAMRLNERQIKCIMSQLLRALCHCHANDVLHRDIKPENVLINTKWELKLADFGLGRTYDISNGMTPNVASLWYKSPELLLGDSKYGSAVDMWSVGCIFGELLSCGEKLFKGLSEFDTLHKIFELRGYSDEIACPKYFQVVKQHLDMNGCLEEKFSHVSPDALDLLSKLLTLDPSKRISASEALESDYLRDAPTIYELKHWQNQNQEEEEEEEDSPMQATMSSNESHQEVDDRYGGLEDYGECVINSDGSNSSFAFGDSHGPQVLHGNGYNVYDHLSGNFGLGDIHSQQLLHGLPNQQWFHGNTQQFNHFPPFLQVQMQDQNGYYDMNQWQGGDYRPYFLPQTLPLSSVPCQYQAVQEA